MLKYNISFLFVLFMVSIVVAQPLTEATYEMKIIKSEELVAEGDYYNALDMYEECYKESKDPFLIGEIARLNYILRDYERAEKWYERMVEKPEKYYTNLLDTFFYAHVLKVNRKYPESFEMFRQFAAVSDNDSLVILADNELIGMDLASKMIPANDIFVEPLATDVNTSLTEASPVYGSDGYLYYSTFKRKSKIVITGDEDNYHFKIYRSKKEDDGKWSKPDKLTKKINREDYHTGNVSFSKDGNTMFFTRSRLNGDSILSSKIYYSTFDGDKWQGARELDGVNGNWIATHPAFGALFGDEVLYFVSDMPGGYGGYDIFYCTNRGANEYSTPVNLGRTINTKGDDVTPFYVDGTLYFSSNGHPGLGGLDIYACTWDGNSWSHPINQGLPHNSTYDDFYFSWEAEEKKGFLVSNRPYPKKKSSKSETCCDDIFEVAEQDIAINTLVTVFDKAKKPLPGAKVILKEYNRGDVNIVDTRKSNKGNTFNIPLKVDKQYRVVIQHDNFKSDSFEINTVGLLDPKTYEKQFYLTPKDKPQEEIKIVTINEPIRLNRIYYDFDDDKILPDAEPDLNTLRDLMNQYPTMVIELSSHTDARGNDGYNQNLSQRRAESAKRWLVQQGTNPARIEAVGWGETKILNQCTNGVSCNEEEHRFNRRTEFKIIAGPRTIELKIEVVDPQGGSDRSGSVIPKHSQTTTSVASADQSIQVPETTANKKNTGDTHSAVSDAMAEMKTKKAQIEIKGKFKDFGIIYAGEKRTHIIEFKNTGDAALVLERVTGEKCLSISWPDYPILPGQSAEITTVYDSTSRHGEDELSLDIITNTDQRVHSARIRAFVQ